MPRRWKPGSTIVSRMNAWVPPSQTACTKPTSRPALKAPTQVRLWRSSRSAHGRVTASGSGRSGLNARWCSADSSASSIGNLTFSSTVIASDGQTTPSAVSRSTSRSLSASVSASRGGTSHRSPTPVAARAAL